MASGNQGGLGAKLTSRGRRGHRARPVAEILEARQLLATITVNTTGDADGADGSNTLSLRQAIEIANGTLPVASLTSAQAAQVSGPLSIPDTIDFDIPGTGPFTITPATELPTITVPVFIDGYSQTGASPNTNGPGLPDDAVIQVGLSAVLLTQSNSNPFFAPTGLALSGGNSTVQGLSIIGFQNISYFPIEHGDIVEYNGAAISLQLKGGDVVRGNFLGLDALGNTGDTFANANGVEAGVGDTIGGTAASDRNVISGNHYGVSGGDLVEGNFIGTDLTGTKPVSNVTGVVGVATVGGTTITARNIISGNNVGVSGGSLVEGNFIGTDPTGTNPLANGTGVSGSATVGGTTAAARNIISGNGMGVLNSPLVEGNYIGTDPTGTKALPNGTGVEIYGDNSNTIGGTAAGAGNVISGNSTDGIDILYDEESNDLYVFSNSFIASNSNLIEGNLIGTDPTGKDALPNGGNGILINGGSSDTIGGTSAGAANVIAFNGKSGIGMETNDFPVGYANYINYYDDGLNNAHNLISGNSIYANGGLGIDLGNDGVTPNNPAGSPTGPNLLQPYPVILSATPTSSGSLISARLDALPSTLYTIEFFSNTVADPTGYGQGKTYLGSTVATTDALGQASFTFDSASALGGQSVTATATDPLGDTSEFSRDLLAYSTTTQLASPPGPVFTGQPLTLLATVGPAPGAGTPTGQVTFTEDGPPIGSANLDAAGSASLTIPAPAGSHAFAATFAGSAGNPGSVSDEVFVTAVKQATTTSLVGPNKIATLGVPTTFTAVVGATVGGVPGGQVNFLEDGVVIGSAPLDASGVAVFITDQLLARPARDHGGLCGRHDPRREPVPGHRRGSLRSQGFRRAERDLGRVLRAEIREGHLQPGPVARTGPGHGELQDRRPQSSEDHGALGGVQPGRCVGDPDDEPEAGPAPVVPVDDQWDEREPDCRCVRYPAQWPEEGEARAQLRGQDRGQEGPSREEPPPDRPEGEGPQVGHFGAIPLPSPPR